MSPGQGVKGQLHWTIMQLVGFNDYETKIEQQQQPQTPTYSQEDYVDCIQDSLTCGGCDSTLEIQFVGVIAVATGLLMIGVCPHLDMNDVRERLRSRLQMQNLPLKEPFVNDIIHSTLFRVLQQDNDDATTTTRAANEKPIWAATRT